MKKKWSTKKKVLVIIAIVLVAALLAGIIYYIARPEKGADVTLVSTYKGDITQTLDATATVESANQGKFEALNGVKAIKVNVRVGDRFKKGDVLATFDTTGVDDLVAEKKSDYNTAKSAYDAYVSGAASAGTQLEELNAQIAELESKVGSTPSSSASSSSEASSGDKSKFSQRVSDFLKDVFSFDEIKTVLDNMLGSNSTMAQISDLLNGSSADELELVSLKAKQILLQAQSSDMLKSTYKTLSDNALAAYERTKLTAEILKKGWTAKEDGIVREVNITAGQEYVSPSASAGAQLDISSIISIITSGGDISKIISNFFAPATSAMTVEYYPFTAVLILGKYDVLKVSMDQDVTVKSADGKEYKGKVTYISPVASSETSINISSLLGSGSSAGVEARVSIRNPDESIIIGFDVEISIATDSVSDALLIPIESLNYDSAGTSVYIYDEETKTIKKTPIETGVFDGTAYQVLSGCKLGDRIVQNPSPKFTDGDKVNVVSEVDSSAGETVTKAK